MKAISEQKPGTVITLTGYRKDEPFNVQVKIIQRPHRVTPKERL
jgi:hypothetical protein